jgi:hypothetical protein
MAFCELMCGWEADILKKSTCVFSNSNHIGIFVYPYDKCFEVTRRFIQKKSFLVSPHLKQI